MNQYTIYCTESQTRKALELGAPIERGHESSRYFNIGMPTFYDENDEVCRVKNSIIFIPTAEQMIGWLEEKLRIISFDIVHYPRCGYGFSLMYENGIIEHLHSEDCLLYRSRADVTLAAIDAALEYITQLNRDGSIRDLTNR